MAWLASQSHEFFGGCPRRSTPNDSAATQFTSTGAALCTRSVPPIIWNTISKGLVWEGEQFYDALDDALTDLERGLAQWLKEMAGKGDE